MELHVHVLVSHYSLRLIMTQQERRLERGAGDTLTELDV
jgi:hypothetical protein